MPTFEIISPEDVKEYHGNTFSSVLVTVNTNRAHRLYAHALNHLKSNITEDVIRGWTRFRHEDGEWRNFRSNDPETDAILRRYWDALVDDVKVNYGIERGGKMERWHGQIALHYIHHTELQVDQEAMKEYHLAYINNFVHHYIGQGNIDRAYLLQTITCYTKLSKHPDQDAAYTQKDHDILREELASNPASDIAEEPPEPM